MPEASRLSKPKENRGKARNSGFPVISTNNSVMIFLLKKQKINKKLLKMLKVTFVLATQWIGSIGDVGFGKTEVAMRAAMYSVIEGYQVLFFVPTTVLCEQHYFRFLQRFSKFGISVSCLNRFHKKHSKQIIQDFLDKKQIFLLEPMLF